MSTDPRTLAALLELIADPDFRSTLDSAAKDIRAAAVLLRRHADLLDAIGVLMDPQQHNSIKLRQTAKRIADAVDGPT